LIRGLRDANVSATTAGYTVPRRQPGPVLLRRADGTVADVRRGSDRRGCSVPARSGCRVWRTAIAKRL